MNCENLKEIDLTNLDTSDVTDFSGMFEGCTALEKVNLSKIDTSKAKEMGGMFYDCSSLASIDLSGLNTSSVKSMMDMFDNCTNLKEVNMSGLDLNNLWATSSMFSNCESLTDVNFSGSKMNNLLMSSMMFSDCKSLTTLDLTSFGTTNLRMMGGMFKGCDKLTTIIVSPRKWNTNKVGDDSGFREILDKEGWGEFLDNYRDNRPMFVAEATWQVFERCSSIKGGSGTTYDSNKTDSSYAIIDGGTSKPGYLTAGKDDSDDKPDPSNPTSLDPTKRFTDVAEGKWYSKSDGPISYVISKHIMSGTGDGSTFDPDGKCTREMFVTTLYNAEGTPGPGPNNPFSDVAAGKWYTKAVTWAVDKGITAGTSATTFGVGGKVTREQLAQFLMNYAKMKGKDISARADLGAYPDSGEISGWAKEAMAWANANKIINGKKKDGSVILDPKGKASRVEVAQMMMSFQKTFGE